MGQNNRARPEQAILDALERRFRAWRPPVRVGIGHDAAVLSAGREVWVVSVDACVQGVHFDSRYVMPRFIGTRALGAALSDLAAAGAEPVAYLVSLQAPAGHSARAIRSIYDGLDEVARRAGAQLIGGNLTRGRDLALHTTVLGRALDGFYFTRAGGRPGDGLFVTGRMGMAAWGGRLLQRGGRPGSRAGREAVRRFLTPSPRLEEGRFLARHRLAHAVMDISDGFLMDLSRLCRASRVGARVRAGALHRPPSGDSRDGPNLRDVLAGGEDYELLAAIPERRIKRLSPRARSFFDRAFARVGEIVEGRSLLLEYPSGKMARWSGSSVPGWDPWRA